MKGIANKILVVDLTSRSYRIEELPEEIYRQYLGGYGLGVWYIYNHIKPGCDPLGPDNILGFTPGLFTGSGAGFTGRYMVCGKSPLTGKGIRTNGEFCSGGWGNASSGGLFGAAIKLAGFDAIFFHGASETPVYLLIKKKQITIEDAETLWGTDIVKMEEELKKLHGDKVHVAGIGSAGENLDLIAGIANDRGRIAARSGLGAVMGSKKLKAICLDGNFNIEYADSKAMRQLNRQYFAQVQKYKNFKPVKALGSGLDYFGPIMRIMRMGLTSAAPPAVLPYVIAPTYGGSQLGTPMSSVISAESADSPIKNYAGNAPDDFPFKRSMKLRIKQINKYKTRQYGCFSCPLRCGAILNYDKLPYGDKETHRPEYETVAAFGSLILNDDLDLLLQANEYLNRVGMDTISAGVTVAYVLEGVERDYFHAEDFVCKDYPNGFSPRFNDPTYIMPLLKLIVTREGIGDKFADGTFVAKDHFPGTEEFAINANGSEMGMHDLRAGKAWGMSYISDPTPGRHTAANYDMGRVGMPDFYPPLRPYVKTSDDPYEQGVYSVTGIKMHQVMEALGMCMFIYFLSDYRLEAEIKAVTGCDMNVEEILAIGDRIQTMRQMFNAREGAIRHKLPQRAIGSPPLKNGAASGNSVDPETMVQGYYKGMGFRTDGVPTEETLHKLGLDEIISDLAICTCAPSKLVNEYLASQPMDAGKRGNKKHKPAIGG